MKILFHTTDRFEAEQARMLLELKGIPVFLGNENSGPALAFILANKYTVWVCLEHQYDDAKAVLADPDSEVANPVDIAEYRTYVEQAAPEIGKRMFDNMMLLAVVGMAIVVAIGIVAVRR